MSSPSDSDVQLEVALCKAGVPKSVAYELSKLLPVVRRTASGVVLGIEVDGALDEGVPAGGTTGQVLTKQSSATFMLWNAICSPWPSAPISRSASAAMLSGAWITSRSSA